PVAMPPTLPPALAPLVLAGAGLMPGDLRLAAALTDQQLAWALRLVPQVLALGQGEALLVMDAPHLRLGIACHGGGAWLVERSAKYDVIWPPTFSAEAAPLYAAALIAGVWSPGESHRWAT
ncbi:hypothetical protein, partial [Deinococcus marmoris]|uniref:hypothetical protein n=2 Tax=Deinococcus marmoris TaxID=249408 RepID=UPI0039F09A25